MKLFKYQLEQISQKIDIAIKYIVERYIRVEEHFIISESTLGEYGISINKFVKYLKDDLSKDDECYFDCNEIWSSNKAVYVKEADNDSTFSKNNQNSVILIKTHKGDIKKVTSKKIR
jgi:hypothetical protein